MIGASADRGRWGEALNGGAGTKRAGDSPSGLHGDTGLGLGGACRADVTVTFAAPKLGLVQPGARDYVGKLVVVPLGLPE